MDTKREKILGFDVDVMSFNEFSGLIFDAVKNSKGMQVVTINPEMIDLASKNPEFASLLHSADLVVPESSGIRLALRFKGISQEPVAGVDLSKKLISLCAENNIKVGFVGAKEEIVLKAVENLKSEFNNLEAGYIRNGYFSENDEPDIINGLKNSGSKLILVATGAPKQEFFIKKCRETISDAVFIGVGGSFDVWSGCVKRAPRLFRIFGCEWLYRTIRQPERIKRIYKTLPMFLINIIIDKVVTKKE